MELKLKRPLVFFDLETTGLSVTEDRIVEIALVKLHPGGETEELSFRINPGRPIPVEASAVHGIYDKDVQDCPLFEQKAQEVVDFIKGCDIAGYNSDHFDIPMLQESLLRAGVGYNLMAVNRIDVQTIYHMREQRTLQAAYKFYVNPEGFDGAHGALSDTRATCEVLAGELRKYEDLPDDVEALARYTARNRNVDCSGRIVLNERNQPCINFGKYKGRPVEEVLRSDLGYYSWMMQGDFPLHTKHVISEIKRNM